MKSFFFIISYFFLLEGFSFVFIQTSEQLDAYSNRQDLVLITSTGRSGSTVLTQSIEKCSLGNFIVVKSHTLPPKPDFKGKILFIFSNPDLAAESILHQIMEDKNFGKSHFLNMETSDLEWKNSLKNIENQTVESNLLCYDALGIEKHLREWLFLRTEPSNRKNAQILAIKYEYLWNLKTQEMIMDFLSLDEFELPEKHQRGLWSYSEKERELRNSYNMGSEFKPRYIVYDNARDIWKKAPPFQFLKITEN